MPKIRLAIMILILLPTFRLFASAQDELQTPHELRVETVEWSPDGTMIALGGGSLICTKENADQFSVAILDASTRQVIKRLSGHDCSVNSIAWSPDGSRIASSSIDSKAIVWDVASGEIIATSSPPTRGVGEVVWSADGTKIANVWMETSIFEIWDAATGESIQTVGLTGSTPIFTIAWGPDGTKIVTDGGDDNTLRIWDAATGQLIQTITEHSDLINSVKWSPDGSKLASTSLDQTLRIWNAATGQSINVIQTPVAPWRLDWHPSGNAIAVIMVDENAVRIWDIRTGEELAAIQSTVGRIHDVDWSPDGSQLVYIGDETGVEGENLQMIPAPEALIPESTPPATHNP